MIIKVGIKLPLFISLWFCSPFLLIAQERNLIPYGSLEITDEECQEMLANHRAYLVDDLPGGDWVSWHKYSVDFFSSCPALEDQQPPLTFAGYQEAIFGSNYGGFEFFVEVKRLRKNRVKVGYHMELPGVKLKEELMEDSIYYFEGYFSLTSDGRIPYFNCGRIDFLFHRDSLRTTAIPLESPVQSWSYPDANVIRIPAYHLNDDDWIKLSFTFKAQGGERFLSFGQIWNDSTDIPICAPAHIVYGDTVFVKASHVLFDNLSLTKGVPKLELELPNVFTPNGDGINDSYAFHLEGVYDEINYQIFNRWGAQVYEGDAFSKLWDGTQLNGKPCEEGVYFVKVKAKERYGIWKETSGFVHLVR